MDRAAIAEGLWDRVIALVDDLGPEDWRRPSPLPGWSVRDVVGHIGGVQVGFDAGTRVPPPEGWEPDPTLSPLDSWAEAGVAARRPWDTGQLRAEVAEAKEGHLARLRAVTDWSAQADGPLGRTTEDALFQVRMFDVWVHLQDLRDGLGLGIDAEDTSPAAATAHGYVVGLLPWLWVKRAGAQEHATMRVAVGPPVDLDTVLEVSVGRARRNPDADPGVCSVTGAAAAFTLLAAGRHEPGHLRDLGLLDWTGPRGEEFVARARLF